MTLKGGCIETQICGRLPNLKRYIDANSGGPGAKAEDICGDAILKIWRIVRSGKFKEGFSVSTLMWCCAKSAMIDYYKKENRAKRIHNGKYEHHFSASVRSPEKEYEALMESNAFMEETEKLRVICRRILILSLFQNMKHREIAETLGMPRSTVSAHMLRMRKELGDIHLNKARIRMEMTGG